MIRVGVIGCGAIGSEIVKYIPNIPSLKASFVCDIDSNRAERLANSVSPKPKVVDIQTLILKSDLVVEAASSLCVKEIFPLLIKNKRPALIMSVGGIDSDMLNLAEKEGIKMCIPSGAIAGLDGLKAGFFGNIKSVLLRTRKPPKGLIGAPYLIKNKIDISHIKEERVVFSGCAKDAIAGFPQNVNVASTLSLAGVGFDRTTVEIVADPNINKNIHEVFIEGDFGKITIRCENLPSPSNPKTSYLAILSCIATLKGIASTAKIGT